MMIHKYVLMRLLPAPVMVSDGKSGVRCRWTPIALDQAALRPVNGAPTA